MGCFAFSCSSCGEKTQDESCTDCVVFVRGLAVKGDYSDYGYVDVTDHNGGNVSIYLEQFSEYFSSWGVPRGSLTSSRVYCAEREEEIDTTKYTEEELEAYREELEGQRPKRYCVSDHLEVLEKLPEVLPADEEKFWEFFDKSIYNQNNN
eukprot:m.245765 g.245765  ORF g.245765 m.245765 type:complete len:150 (+) comp16109_c3_seq14:54-503(+)